MELCVVSMESWGRHMGRHCVVDRIVSYLRFSFPLFHGLNSVLNVKALVGAFNQEKALVGAFSMIVQSVVEPMDRFAALVWTLIVH